VSQILQVYADGGSFRYIIGAGSPPAVSDDLDLGFEAGDLWLDTTLGGMHVAKSVADGAAVWVPCSPTSNTISTLAAGDMFLVRDDSDTGDPIETATLTVVGTGVATVNNYVAGAWSGAGVAGTNCTVGSVTGSYIRMGDRVVCSGAVASVNPTAAGPTATDFELPLPVASNFAATTDASGVATSASAFEFGIVTGSVANDRLVVNLSAVADTTQSVYVFATYAVI
jgi:hypothetical protein